uniref:Uncharacterized protein n=1 Tax=Trichogramma kaykai TaxID=54128 RepID=A0ABD2XDE2_9HYME
MMQATLYIHYAPLCKSKLIHHREITLVSSQRICKEPYYRMSLGVSPRNLVVSSDPALNFATASEDDEIYSKKKVSRRRSRRRRCRARFGKCEQRRGAPSCELTTPFILLFFVIIFLCSFSIRGSFCERRLLSLERGNLNSQYIGLFCLLPREFTHVYIGIFCLNNARARHSTGFCYIIPIFSHVHTYAVTCFAACSCCCCRCWPSCFCDTRANWKTKRGRDEFLSQLLPIIKLWKDGLPDLREIFSKKEIECLLAQSAGYMRVVAPNNPGQAFLQFVIRTGYKDEPDVDEDGKPLLRRSTPVHRVAMKRCSKYVGAFILFKIYDRFDLNYTNESGLTHFHVACTAYCNDVVKTFLELGQDPNLIWRETGDSPLHLALWHRNVEVAEMLLKNGADPNLANKDGWTSLHIISRRYHDDDDADNGNVVEMLSKISDEKHQPLYVNARDKYGTTPLHIALFHGFKKMAKLLLKKGADPNSTNSNELTPLHMICKRGKDDDLVETFFNINSNHQQKIMVDVQDEDGWTPLNWAVARFMPNVVESLLDHDADLSNFAFPTESDLDRGCEEWLEADDSLYYALELVTRVLIVIERLEKRGFKLDRSSAITIMNVFAKHKVFEMSDELLNNKDEFVREAKKWLINSSLLLYDLTRLQPKEGEKRLTYKDFLEFASTKKFSFLEISDCVGYLCEIISRGFFRRWTLDSFSRMTPHQLSIECFDEIIKQLTNRDLHNICLAVTDQSHEDGEKKCDNCNHCHNERPDSRDSSRTRTDESRALLYVYTPSMRFSLWSSAREKYHLTLLAYARYIHFCQCNEAKIIVVKKSTTTNKKLKIMVTTQTMENILSMQQYYSQSPEEPVNSSPRRKRNVTKEVLTRYKLPYTLFFHTRIFIQL